MASTLPAQSSIGARRKASSAAPSPLPPASAAPRRGCSASSQEPRTSSQLPSPGGGAGAVAGSTGPVPSALDRTWYATASVLPWRCSCMLLLAAGPPAAACSSPSSAGAASGSLGWCDATFCFSLPNVLPRVSVQAFHGTGAPPELARTRAVGGRQHRGAPGRHLLVRGLGQRLDSPGGPTAAVSARAMAIELAMTGQSCSAGEVPKKCLPKQSGKLRLMATSANRLGFGGQGAQGSCQPGCPFLAQMSLSPVDRPVAHIVCYMLYAGARTAEHAWKLATLQRYRSGQGSS